MHQLRMISEVIIIWIFINSIQTNIFASRTHATSGLNARQGAPQISADLVQIFKFDFHVINQFNDSI